MHQRRLMPTDIVYQCSISVCDHIGLYFHTYIRKLLEGCSETVFQNSFQIKSIYCFSEEEQKS